MSDRVLHNAKRAVRGLAAAIAEIALFAYGAGRDCDHKDDAGVIADPCSEEAVVGFAVGVVGLGIAFSGIAEARKEADKITARAAGGRGSDSDLDSGSAQTDTGCAGDHSSAQI